MKLFDSNFPVSIEEFAAYLDGNLSPQDMQRVSSIIDTNEMMKEVADSSDQADETLAAYSAEDMELPEDIASGCFRVPKPANTPRRPSSMSGLGMCACFAAPLHAASFLKDTAASAIAEHYGISEDDVKEIYNRNFSNSSVDEDEDAANSPDGDTEAEPTSDAEADKPHDE